MLKTGVLIHYGFSVERITFSLHRFTEVIRYQMEEIQPLYFTSSNVAMRPSCLPVEKASVYGLIGGIVWTGIYS